MSSDFHLVEPRGWEYDLQSIYAAYIGYFQLHGIPWHDRTWGPYFDTFDQFLAFSWPVITVTDKGTGRAHIVTRMTSIRAFLKMIQARFCETLPQVDNLLVVTPFETAHRPLRHIGDAAGYRKLHAALPAVALAALKARVRGGDLDIIRALWDARDKTFVALDLTWHERACLAWGYAAVRSPHLVAAGAWPPTPSMNYRKGHYLISEYADPIRKPSSAAAVQYAFGDSRVVPKAKLPGIMQSIFSSMLSPDSETVANNVVLVGHGVQVLLQRLDELQIRLPANVLTIDIAYLECALFTSGARGSMHAPKTGKPRAPGSLLSLGGLLRSFGIVPPCVLHHAGNDAFMALVAFQRMVDPRGGVGRGALEMDGQGAQEQGQGHVKRAATVAARIFRPLSGNVPTPSGVDDAKRRVRHTQSAQLRTVSGTDEMGVLGNDAQPKRASMMPSAWRTPSLAPFDKGLKEPSNGSTSGNGSKSGSKSGRGSALGWLSPSNMITGQRRHSTLVER